MRLQSTIALGLTLFLACCNPAQPPDQAVSTNEADERDINQREVLNLATQVVAADLGQPVQLAVDTFRMQESFAWLIARPQTPTQQPIDFSQTRYAERVANGTFDGPGNYYMLFAQVGGQWVLREYTVAPTSVEWLTWPQKYDAPPELFSAE